MKLILRPVGRGNWAPLSMTLDGKWSVIFGCMHGFKVGERVKLAGITWRVCEVIE